MLTFRNENYMRWAWLVVTAGLIFRLTYAAQFHLVPDETNYWQWARHLDWGYHDQAPLIGWAIWLTTWLFGHTEWAVRLPTVIAMGIASVYLVLIARKWLSVRIAFHTAVLTQGLLLTNVGGLLATADGLQAAGWAAAAYHIAAAYDNDNWRQWLLAGFWFGFGLLGKFTMVIILPCAYLYGLMSPLHRRRLAGIKPYVGVAVGLLMFAPVIYWNAVHDWNSVRHVAYIGGANEGFELHLKYLGEFIGAQAALMTPVVFVLVLISWLKAWHTIGDQKRWIFSYLVFLSLPMVAGFAVLSLHTRVYANWPAAGYLTAIVLVSALWSPGREKRGKEREKRPSRAWAWAVGSTYLLSTVLLIHVIWPILPIPDHRDRTAREIVGWDQVGQQAAMVKSVMPRPEKTFLFGIRYQIASELAFYSPGQPPTVAINRWDRPNVYDYWWKDSDLMGWDAVGVAQDGHRQQQFMQVFETADPPIALSIYRNADAAALSDRQPVKILYIYRCYGFKGGLRWVPPDKSDIRSGANG